MVDLFNVADCGYLLAVETADESADEKYPAGWLAAYSKLDLAAIKSLAAQA